MLFRCQNIISDFSKEQFIKAPDAKWEIVEIDGVAPEYFHSDIYVPEYFKIQASGC